MALDAEVNLVGENTHAAKHRICITEVSLAQEQANGLYSRQYHQASCTVWLRQILNPFQPKLILVHTTVTGICRRANKTCKNWPLCSYVR